MNTIYFLKLNARTNLERIAQRKLCSEKAKKIVEMAACEFWGNNPNIIQFKKGENGKPYIKNLPDFHFNISHSGNAVTVAISDSEVGIDCEKLRNADLRIAKRRFTEKEYAYIIKDSSKADLRFFEIWTKKESFLKQNGKGITQPLNSFDVTDDSLGKSFHTYQKDGFFISVCTDSPNIKFTFLEIAER